MKKKEKTDLPAFDSTETLLGMLRDRQVGYGESATSKSSSPSQTNTVTKLSAEFNTAAHRRIQNTHNDQSIVLPTPCNAHFFVVFVI